MAASSSPRPGSTDPAMATSHGSGTVVTRCAVPLRRAGWYAIRLAASIALGLAIGTGLTAAAVALGLR